MANFVSSRARWHDPDQELMARVTREVLPPLREIETAIWEKREKQQAARQTRADNNNVGGGRGGAGGGGGGGGRQGPRDTEARELLMEIGVPAKTTYVAIGHLALAITLLLYAASSLTSIDNYIVGPFINGIVPWMICASLCMLITGLFSGYHGLNMNFPVRKPFILIVRTFWLIVTTGLVVSAAIATSITHFGHTSPVTGQSLRGFYDAAITTDPTAYCSFSTTYRCSGWDVPCSVDSTQAYCISACYNTLVVMTSSCQEILEGDVSGVMLPSAIMFYLSCVTLLLDWIFYQRFFHYGKLLAAAMGLTFTGEPATAVAATPAAAAAAAAPARGAVAAGGGGRG